MCVSVGSTCAAVPYCGVERSSNEWVLLSSPSLIIKLFVGLEPIAIRSVAVENTKRLSCKLITTYGNTSCCLNPTQRSTKGASGGLFMLQKNDFLLVVVCCIASPVDRKADRHREKIMVGVLKREGLSKAY